MFDSVAQALKFHGRISVRNVFQVPHTRRSQEGLNPENVVAKQFTHFD
jgi:hypothetical protein